MIFIKASGSKIFYHIGKSPAKPEPYSISKEKKRFYGPEDTGKWERPQHPGGVENGVFLTSNWKEVAFNHGILDRRILDRRILDHKDEKRLNVYVYKIDMGVVKESGGEIRYGGASELLIPLNIWKKYKIFYKNY